MPRYIVKAGTHTLKDEKGVLRTYRDGEEFTSDDEELMEKFPNKFERNTKPGRPPKKKVGGGGAEGEGG